MSAGGNEQLAGVEATGGRRTVQCSHATEKKMRITTLKMKAECGVCFALQPLLLLLLLAVPLPRAQVAYLDLLAPSLSNSCIAACPWHVTPRPTVATAAHFKPPTNKSGSNYKSSCR